MFAFSIGKREVSSISVADTVVTAFLSCAKDVKENKRNKKTTKYLIVSFSIVKVINKRDIL
jgi:lactate dehydrogenase-like 2-hydroxyacid dehydrogenase